MDNKNYFRVFFTPPTVLGPLIPAPYPVLGHLIPEPEFLVSFSLLPPHFLVTLFLLPNLFLAPFPFPASSPLIVPTFPVPFTILGPPSLLPQLFF